MKKRVKKLIALLMTAIALSWVVPQGMIDVLAAEINLDNSTDEIVEISTDSADTYIFGSGKSHTLIVKKGVTLSGAVNMEFGYGKVENKGTITGAISGLNYSTKKVTNESTGMIKSDLTISGGTLSNSGTIQSDISILTGTISNSGTLNSVTMKSDSKSQKPTLEMNGGTLTSLKVETGESNPQINLNEGEITTLDMSYGTVEMTGGTVDTLNTGGGTFNPSVNLNGGTVTMLNHRGGFVHIRDGGNVITMDGTGNDTMYGGTITTLNTSGGTFDMFGGTITTLNIIKGKYTMTGGNVDTLNAINGEFIPTIELGGGVVTTLNADGKTVKITGTPVITEAKVSEFTETGTVTVVDSVELGGSTATVNVKPTTKVKVTGESDVTVTVPVEGSNDNKKTVTIPADASVYTPLALRGKTVTFTTGTGHMSTTDALPTGRYWFGASTEVVTYKADNGYYFPTDYESSVSCNGTGTTNITRENESTIQVSYTLGADEADNVTLTLPAATPKANQAAPTKLVGEVKKITGTTALMEYAQNSDATDSEWQPCTEGTTEIPTAGTWYVRYKETEDKLSGQPADVLVLTEGTGSITVEDIYYGKQPLPIVNSNTNGTGDVRIEYKKKSEEDDKYTTVVPTAVGDYTARAIFARQGVYDIAIATDDFSITFMRLAKDPYTISAEKGNNGFYKSIVTVIAEQGYLLAEKLDGDYVSSFAYDTSKEAFSLFAMKQDTGEKSDAIGLAGFKIDRVAPSIDAADGQTYHMDTVEFTITDDNLESVLVNGKNVTVDATGKIAFQSNDRVTDYEVVITDQAGNTKRVNFTVATPKKNQAAPTGLVGGVRKITGTTTLMEYAQNSDADDSAWSPCTEGTTEIPTEGTWYVRYKKAEDKLSGQPAGVLVLTEGAGSITVEDIYYGKQPSPSVESATNGTENVTIEYKKKSEADDKYTTEVPTAVGDYTARASFAIQGVYDGVVATDDFSITFMSLAKAPYMILAEKGNNGFYKSIVKVIAEQGYLLAEKLDGKYVSSLAYDTSKGAFSLFAMKQDTGEKSDAIGLAGFKVDRVAPHLDAVDAQTYYTDIVEFAITDDNLESILVNGENVTVDATGKIAFPSNSGATDYEVVITDQAGNIRRVSFTVASKWVKSGVVPTGQTVLLTTENAYKLGSGTWMVNGDSTSYNGNQNFYVGSEGEYVFTGDE